MHVNGIMTFECIFLHYKVDVSYNFNTKCNGGGGGGEVNAPLLNPLLQKY